MFLSPAPPPSARSVLLTKIAEYHEAGKLHQVLFDANQRYPLPCHHDPHGTKTDHGCPCREHVAHAFGSVQKTLPMRLNRIGALAAWIIAIELKTSTDPTSRQEFLNPRWINALEQNKLLSASLSTRSHHDLFVYLYSLTPLPQAHPVSSCTICSQDFDGKLHGYFINPDNNDTMCWHCVYKAAQAIHLEENMSQYQECHQQQRGGSPEEAPTREKGKSSTNASSSAGSASTSSTT